jgi:Ribbon-helix-helix protein, copG family
MLTSRIMVRRTTVAADRDALDTLEAEARRRGVSLSAVLAEAVEDKAASIRAARRPRIGLGRSTDGRSAAELTAEPVAEPPA